MAKREPMDDPLKDLDPVMKDAFSSSSDREKEEKESAIEVPEIEEKDKEKLEKEETTHIAGEVKVSSIQFPDLDKEIKGKGLTPDVFGNIPIEVTVELGKTKVSLKEIYELSEGSIIELSRLAGEPLDLVVNGQVIAQGEVVAVDDNYGLRITNIIAK